MKVWILMLSMSWLLLGCTTPSPIVRTPDIVEISVPTPVLGNFGCQCSCECEPNKELELEFEEELKRDPFLYNPLIDE